MAGEEKEEYSTSRAMRKSGKQYREESKRKGLEMKKGGGRAACNIGRKVRGKDEE